MAFADRLSAVEAFHDGELMPVALQEFGELQFPTNALIDGAFRQANSGKTFTSTNPATGEVLAEI
ncbi:hypothetical protein ACCS72_38910, partial [Rhizobium ruizarguesonis]